MDSGATICALQSASSFYLSIPVTKFLFSSEVFNPKGFTAMSRKVPVYDMNDILAVQLAESDLQEAIADALHYGARPGDNSEHDRRCRRLQNELRIAKQTAYQNARANTTAHTLQ